jgi:hypothetical protein
VKEGEGREEGEVRRREGERRERTREGQEMNFWSGEAMTCLPLNKNL